MTKSDDQGGLPADLGNDMSDRSGYEDNSESGEMNTPTGMGAPTGDDLPEKTMDRDNSGTTFDAGNGGLPEEGGV